MVNDILLLMFIAIQLLGFILFFILSEKKIDLFFVSFQKEDKKSVLHRTLIAVGTTFLFPIVFCFDALFQGLTVMILALTNKLPQLDGDIIFEE